MSGQRLHSGPPLGEDERGFVWGWRASVRKPSPSQSISHTSNPLACNESISDSARMSCFARQSYKLHSQINAQHSLLVGMNTHAVLTRHQRVKLHIITTQTQIHPTAPSYCHTTKTRPRPQYAVIRKFILLNPYRLPHFDLHASEYAVLLGVSS